MSSYITCLKKMGKKVPLRDHLFPLNDDQQVLVGRDVDIGLLLPSDMISRKHAVLKKTTAGNWTVADNKSVNGTQVNGKRLPALTAQILCNGDIIQFGVKQSVDLPPPFVYQFLTNHKVKVYHQKKQGRVTSSEESQSSQASNTDRKRKLESSQSLNRVHGSQSAPTKKVKLCMSPDRIRIDREIQDKIRQMENLQVEMEKKMKEAEEKYTKLQEELDEKDLIQAQMSIEIKEKEKKLNEEAILKQEELEKEKQNLEKELKETYERQLKEKVDTLRIQLTTKKQSLLEEKEKLEESIAKEIKKKNKRLEKKLVEEKARLEKIITKKELEQKLLESELNETKSENKKTKEQMLRAREDVLNNFTDLMETELQCSICSELFVQATSLNCSHSFCALCIETWMEKKKECPICRAKITSHIRSIVLDSYIDKMTEQLSEDMIKSRQELLKERKEILAKKVASNAKPGPSRNTRSSTNAVQPPLIVLDENPSPRRRPQPIVISDDDEENSDLSITDTEEEEESDDDEVSRGPHWGGYGNCYRCGQFGHWANRCPNRY